MNVYNSEIELAKENVMIAAQDIIQFELEKADKRRETYNKLRGALKEATESYEKLKEQDE